MPDAFKNLATSPQVTRADLAALLSASDIVTILAELTPELVETAASIDLAVARGSVSRRWRGAPVEPGNTGEWGVAARWSPQWLDGTMGLYAHLEEGGVLVRAGHTEAAVDLATMVATADQRMARLRSPIM